VASRGGTKWRQSSTFRLHSLQKTIGAKNLYETIYRTFVRLAKQEVHADAELHFKAGMTARAMWKGILKIGSSGIPVKLFSAVEDRTVRFHVLESRTKSRVKQRLVRPDSTEDLPKQETRKGYEIEPGEFILVDEAETKDLKPKESRNIQPLRFVAPDAIASEWYERPYYLGPDGEDSKYFALAEAIRNREVQGVMRWGMRGKSYVGALQSLGDYLVLIRLRYTEEVLSRRELAAPSGRALSEKELRMAEELISALEGEFHPEEFRDEYREKLEKFLDAKARGKHPKLRAVRMKTAGPLADQLARSLAAMKRGKEKKVA
jgi:DNA end-binding protein Ku